MSIQFEKSLSSSTREMRASRLTPFEKLPQIGSSNEYIPRPPPTHHIKPNPRSKQYLRQQQPILIAIRLSDGRRLEKEFCSTDRINNIIQFVKSEQSSLDDDIYLSSGDVPKRQFKDFNLTLLQANINTHTVLFMEEEEEEKPSVEFYRQLLNSAKIFLTEADGRSSSRTNRSESISYSECRSLTPSSSPSIKSNEIDEELFSTRHQCRQRMGNCSRKKLSLLTFQQQTDKRYSKFQKFLDDLELKRRTNIVRYQMELKDYLLKRLEADRLKQEVHSLEIQIDQFDENKKRYLPIIEFFREATRSFPPDLFPGDPNDIKSIISRYETLNESKKIFQKRDFINEISQRQKNFQKFMSEHNTQIQRFYTRIAQLEEQLVQVEIESNNQEQQLIYQMDLKRTKTTTISQVESCINYLYERYRLIHELPRGIDDTIQQKLQAIQNFILYRTDLLQRANNI